MSKIIGNTTAVPKVLTEDEVITLVTGSEEVQELIKELGGDEQVQANWEEPDASDPSYIKNKPIILTAEEIAEMIQELGGDGAPQVQADWEQTNQDAVDYIKNKPDIPTEVEIIELIREHALDDQIQVDWEQNDTTQADFIKNKPTILTEDDVKKIIGETDPINQVQTDWAQADSSKVDYIKNKPDFEGLEATVDGLQARVLPEVTAADNGKSLQVVDGVWQTKVIQGGGGGGADPIRRITLNGSGNETLSLTFDNNTIYDIGGYSNLTFTCPAGEYNAYFYIALPDVDNVAINLPSGLSKAGDKVSTARGGEIWEISIDSSLGILSLNVRAIDYD